VVGVPGEAFPPPLGGAWGAPEAGVPMAGTPMASALRARGRAVDEQPVACFVTVEAAAGAGAHPVPPTLATSPALAGRALGGASSGASLEGEGQGSDGSASEAWAVGGPGGLPAAAVPSPVAVMVAAPGLDSGVSGASADGGCPGTEVDPSSRPARRRSAAAKGGEFPAAAAAGERPGSPSGAPASPTAGRAPRSTRARKTSTWGQKSQLAHPPAAAGGRRAAGGSPRGGRKGKGAVPRSPSGELSRGTADSEHTSVPAAAKVQAQPAHQCVRCGTTTTPLWRAGPKGPKTLCNACGVRHMKAMRKKAAGRA